MNVLEFLEERGGDGWKHLRLHVKSRRDTYDAGEFRVLLEHVKNQRQRANRRLVGQNEAEERRDGVSVLCMCENGLQEKQVASDDLLLEGFVSVRANDLSNHLLYVRQRLSLLLLLALHRPHQIQLSPKRAVHRSDGRNDLLPRALKNGQHAAHEERSLHLRVHHEREEQLLQLPPQLARNLFAAREQHYQRLAAQRHVRGAVSKSLHHFAQEEEGDRTIGPHHHTTGKEVEEDLPRERLAPRQLEEALEDPEEVFLGEALRVEEVGFEEGLAATVEDDDGLGLHEGEELGEKAVEEGLVEKTVEEAAAEAATRYLTHHQIRAGKQGQELRNGYEEGESVMEDLVATLCLQFAQIPEDTAVL